MITYGDLVPVLKELRRTLKPGGVLRLCLPDVDKGIHAYLNGDRSHFALLRFALRRGTGGRNAGCISAGLAR